MVPRNYVPLLASLACIGVLTVYAPHWLKKVSKGISVPAQIKLADFTNGSAQAVFAPPKGSLFNFVIGLPKGTAASTGLRGSISLRQGEAEVYRRAFWPDEVKPCNWLDRRHQEGYILTWHGASNRLDTALQSGKSYSLSIAFEKRPAVPVSLWLTFVQDWQTHDKQKVVEPGG